MLKPRRAAIAAFLAVAWPLASCAEKSSAGDPSAPAAEAWTLDPTGLPRATLVEELRLDADEEDFSVVRAVNVGPNGRIAVPLRQDGEVRVYDAAGTAIGVFGRPGEGPGEFGVLTSVGFVGDTLWARDGRLRRITFFAPDGSVLRTWSPEEVQLDPPDGQGPPLAIPTMFLNPVAVRPDGSMLATARYMYADMSRVSETLAVDVTPDARARLVATPPAYEDPRWMIEVDGLGWPMPFTVMPMTSSTPDGDLLAMLISEATSETGGEVTLTLVRAAGDTVFQHAYPFVGEPVTGSARDSAIDALAPDRPPTEGPPDLYRRRQAIARDQMPTVHPPVTGFRLGMDGTIWIDLRESEEGRVTLVLDGDGRPLAYVLLPEGAVIRQATRTHVWMTEADEFDLSDVVRYRVEGLGGMPGASGG